MGEPSRGRPRRSSSSTVSIATAALGVVLGTLLAYAAATATRPRWLRKLVTSFSGVAANLGGIPLAFAFLALLGRQGLLTKIINTAGFDLYKSGFGFDTVPGLITVYSYFNIPLMLLITLPAIDGLKCRGARPTRTWAAPTGRTGDGSGCRC